MTAKDNILTDKERAQLKSMANYWKEVRNREDTSQLERALGAKILFIIARYIELTEEEEQKG